EMACTQYDPYYGGARQDDRLLASQDLRERVPWTEGEWPVGEAGISYLQLATLRLSGRFSSGNISLHCPVPETTPGVPARIAGQIQAMHNNRSPRKLWGRMVSGRIKQGSSRRKGWQRARGERRVADRHKMREV
ncbi:hypothetical protein WN55_07317, partial [Dufourea novaeangliae]